MGYVADGDVDMFLRGAAGDGRLDPFSRTEPGSLA